MTASRGLSTMIRRRRASSPSDEVVAGFLFELEPFRTTSGRRGGASERTWSRRRVRVLAPTRSPRRRRRGRAKVYASRERTEAASRRRSSPAGRPQATVRGPAPQHYSLTCDLPGLRYIILLTRIVSWRRDVVSNIKCGWLEGRHTSTLLVSKVLGRGTCGCGRALPRAFISTPRPQA